MKPTSFNNITSLRVGAVFPAPSGDPDSFPNEKNRNQSPLVTIFGAGIAGLSAAHELIERGFSVQVVEPTRSPDEEYSVEVGGMARNQFCRIQEDPRILHGPEPVSQAPIVWSYFVEFKDAYEINNPDELTTALAILLEKIETRECELIVAGGANFDWSIGATVYSRPNGTAMPLPERRLRTVMDYIDDLRKLNPKFGAISECRIHRSPECGTTSSVEPRDGVALCLENPLTSFRLEIEKIWAIRPSEMKKVQARFPTPERILFDRKANSLDLLLRDDWGVSNQTKLITAWQTLKRAYVSYEKDFYDDLSRAQQELNGRFVAPCDPQWRCREILLVEVRGHTDDDGEEKQNREISKEWAESVVAYVRHLNRAIGDRGPIPPFDFRYHFKAVGVGSKEPAEDLRTVVGRRRSNRVEFRIVERLVPGEHGYRFFPAFYRHLFDTMRRTPMLDEHFEETGQTTYEHLMPVRDAGIAIEDGGAPALTETRPVGSLEELRRLSLLFFQRLGVTYRDIVRFQTRLLKFLTSSTARRQKEYEDQSWWTFLGGDAERGYSAKMAQYLNETPQALVAMNARETDARSQGNIVCQLQLHYLKREFDRSLNGPTTRVWLRTWKRYLKRQGVRFFVGELGKLEWSNDELVPVTTSQSGWLEHEPAQEPPAPSASSGSTPADAEPPKSVVTPSVLTPRPGGPNVLVEVLDNTDGEYAISISGEPYCFTARGNTREEIAANLVEVLARDPRVKAELVPASTENASAYKRGWTQIRLSHAEVSKNDDAVRLRGEVGKLGRLEIYYSDGPTWKENGVKVITLDKLTARTQKSVQSVQAVQAVLDDANIASHILDGWADKTSQSFNPAKIVCDFLVAALPDKPKADPKFTKLISSLKPRQQRAIRNCVTRLRKDVKNAAEQIASAEGSGAGMAQSFLELIAGFIDGAHDAAEIQHRVDRFLEYCAKLTPKGEAIVQHLAARFARTRTEDLSFIAQIDFDGEEWLTAGRRRMDGESDKGSEEDKQFAETLFVVEIRQKAARALVPKISVEGAGENLVVKFLPPLSPASRSNYSPAMSGLHVVRSMPYVDDLVILDKDEKPSKQILPWLADRRSIWIVVRNADNNLRVIVREPTAEDPGEDYQSHREERVAFRPDFYVLALPFDKASTLVWRAEAERRGVLNGCLSEILDFDRSSERRTQHGAEVRLIRDAYGRPPRAYPLRDFSGIQYYFHKQVRIGKGHLYFPQAEWGLSSVSQLAYWRERMSPTSAFLGQLSVDIGDFYQPAERLGSGRKRPSAWYSRDLEIATEVWRQIQEGIEFSRASVLAPPEYFHLDDWLRFDDARGSSFREEVYVRVFSESASLGDPSMFHRPGRIATRSTTDPPGTSQALDSTILSNDYTVWVNGESFTARLRPTDNGYEVCSFNRDGGEAGVLDCVSFARTEDDSIRLPYSIACYLAMLIKDAGSGSLEASVYGEDPEFRGLSVVSDQGPGNRKELECCEKGRPSDIDSPDLRQKVQKAIGTSDVSILLRVQSKVPPNGALICVTGAAPGNYEVWIGNKRVCFPHTRDVENSGNRRKWVRDNIYKLMMSSPDMPVLVEMSGDTAILLLPRSREQLPDIRVQNESQNLNVIFGQMLHVRLEQPRNQLAFHDPDLATIGYNVTPFLINVPSQWKYRPGMMAPGGRSQAMSDPSHGRKTPIFYRLSNKRWVGAGTYMATTTRLTTMEAANESARHAVNTILHTLVERPGKDYNAQGLLLAEFADIWDPEQNELEDLEPLKRLDEKLANEGLPHVMDILKVMDAVDGLPMHGKASHDPLSNMIHLLQHTAEDFDKEWGFSRETLFGLLGKAAEQAGGALDPFGLLRGALKGAPADIIDKIQRGIRSLMDEPGDRNSGGNKTS